MRYLSHARECYHFRSGVFKCSGGGVPSAAACGAAGLNGTPAQQMFTVAPRRFPPPWRADKMPGANGQALAYVYSHDHEAEALQVKVLTKERCAADRRQHRDAAGAAGEAGY